MDLIDWSALDMVAEMPQGTAVWYMVNGRATHGKIDSKRRANGAYRVKLKGGMTALVHERHLTRS